MLFSKKELSQQANNEECLSFSMDLRYIIIRFRVFSAFLTLISIIQQLLLSE